MLQVRLGILKAINIDLFDLSVSLGVSTVKTKPGTLGDQSKPMTIQLDSNANVDNRCYRVTDANFAVGDRQYIGSHTDANDAYLWIADDSR